MADGATPDRREAAQRMAELAASARRGEAQAAQALIDDFLVRVRAAGIPPQRLMATQLDGREVRTDKTGWYVNKKRSVAIGEDGAWYVLTVPSSALSRFTGVKLEASDPELVVGRGGRDGESGDLADFLARVLAGD
ncbi:MAG: hypothetical protein Q4F65_11690 [Propionibacteriaceae bacterium]|nr:hypothetical protein [Propionibacteriaceae bacterium]